MRQDQSRGIKGSNNHKFNTPLIHRHTCPRKLTLIVVISFWLSYICSRNHYKIEIKHAAGFGARKKHFSSYKTRYSPVDFEKKCSTSMLCKYTHRVCFFRNTCFSFTFHLLLMVGCTHWRFMCVFTQNTVTTCLLASGKLQNMYIQCNQAYLKHKAARKWVLFQTSIQNGFMALAQKSQHLTFSTYQKRNK